MKQIDVIVIVSHTNGKCYFFKWWASVLKNEPEPELPPNFLQNMPEGLQMPGLNKDDKPDL